jgi:hypothetical protein
MMAMMTILSVTNANESETYQYKEIGHDVNNSWDATIFFINGEKPMMAMKLSVMEQVISGI